MTPSRTQLPVPPGDMDADRDVFGVSAARRPACYRAWQSWVCGGLAGRGCRLVPGAPGCPWCFCMRRAGSGGGEAGTVAMWH